MKKNLICKTCGKHFISHLKRENGYTAQFCSRKCIKPRVRKICENCGKEYNIIPYRANKSRWCSRKCMLLNKPISTHVYETAEWKKARQKALERDQYTCQNCGVTKEEALLHVNHIIPYRLIRSHIITNLVTLCDSCHPKMDWKVRDLLGIHPMRKRFIELICEMYLVNLRKSDNYAEDKDPLSNLRSSEAFGVPAPIGAMVRMSDKWSRLVQLMNGKQDKVGESIKDTLMDLAVYCLLEIILLEQEESKQKVV